MSRRTVGLVRFLRERDPMREKQLKQMRAQAVALRNREDLIWRVLLQSAATMGGSAGWRGLFDAPVLCELAGFHSVASISPDLRAAYLATILQSAGVRWPPAEGREAGTEPRQDKFEWGHSGRSSCRACAA